MHSGETRKELIRSLQSQRRIGFICHIRPDGDTLGAALALRLAMLALGKEAIVYCQDKVPEKLAFLPGAETIVHDAAALETCDVIGAIDCAAPDRLGEALTVFEKKENFCLDHHGTNPLYARVNWVEECSAASLLAQELIEDLGVTLDADMADCLYTGIITDTGRFAYSLTEPRALIATAKLMEVGAHFTELQEQLFRIGTYAERRLLGECLCTLETPDEGRFYLLTLTDEMFERAHALPEDAEGFVNYALDIRGTQASALISQSKDGWKVSLRSRGDLYVNGVAQAFGGGGHPNAAGCTLHGTLEEAKAALLAELGRQGIL